MKFVQVESMTEECPASIRTAAMAGATAARRRCATGGWHLMAVAFLMLACGHAVAATVKLIANPSVKADAITPEELKSIFLEDASSLRDGSRVEPVLQKANATHEAFLAQYLERNDSRCTTTIWAWS
jgi:hypothetical protein